MARNVWKITWGAFVAGVYFSMSPGYASEYIVTDLGVVSNTLIEPYALDINIQGDVVGNVREALLWKGADVGLDTLNEVGASVSAINNPGSVTGNHVPQDHIGMSVPFVWHQNTGLTPLESPNAQLAFARDINDKQQVVGNYQESDGIWQAYLWQDNGMGTPLNIFSGEQSIATALNNAEPTQVVGTAWTAEGSYHAFLWAENGDLHDLGEFQARQTVATAVNDHGTVVGWYGSGVGSISGGDPFEFKPIFPSSPNSTAAFMWSEEGGEATWLDLGALTPPNHRRHSVAYAINNAGQVVGYSDNSDEENRAFLYTRENGMRDLNALIPQGSGWILEVAHGINERGQIVGWGTRNGAQRLFLLTPEGVIPPLDIAIHHSTVPQYPIAGEPFVFSTTVVNHGYEAVAVRVVHTLASWLSIESIPDNCRQNDQQLECEIADLPGGTSDTHSVDLQTALWGRWKVASTATATTESGMHRLAEVQSFLPVARNEPEVVPTYTVLNLDTIVTTVDDGGPRINNRGEVALGGERGAVFIEGSVQLKGSANDVLYDVNDQSWFVGSSGGNAALWSMNGWSVFDEFPENGNSSAFALNKDLQAVGIFTSQGNLPEAYVISPNTQALELGAFSGGTSEARDINDNGWIVGRSDLALGAAHAFLYRDAHEGLVDLGTLGGNDSWAYAINNSGVVVGQAETTESEFRAVRWTAQGDISDLGTLIDGGDSRALDVNNAGIAVGDALGLGGIRRAVRFVDGHIEDLNDRLPAGSSWQLDKASGINDSNEIVGIGRLVEDDRPRGYLALPLSPPLFAIEGRLPAPDDPLALAHNHSIAINGTTLAIGNPNDDQQGVRAGAVYIYQRVDDEWVFRTSARAPDGRADDQFGWTVALDGAWLAVGSRSGTYLFQGFGATWAYSGDKLATGNEIWSGRNIALDGQTLAVGHEHNGSRVLIYTFSDGHWQEDGSIELSNLEIWGIEFQNDQLIVNQDGTVDIFIRHENGWLHEQTLDAPFSTRLALDDDTLVVACPCSTIHNIDAGFTNVYKRRNGRWVRHSTLPSVKEYPPEDDSRLSFYATAGHIYLIEEFGYSLAVSGDVIAVGARSSNDGEYGAGAVYIYQLHGSQWIEEAKLIASDAQVNQKLGSTVALEDGILVSGTVNRPDGAIYTYTLNHSPDSADLQLAMFADRNAVGVTEFVTYTLTVTNLSDVAASGIDIVMALPPELDFITASTECGPEAGVIICHVDVIPAAESRQVTITAEALREGTASSQAWVSAYQHDPDQSNNEVSLETLIEEEPPPRIVLQPLCDACGSTITLSPHDALQLHFDIEHWTLEPPDGRHVHWWLNGEFQGHIYQDVIDLNHLEADEHHVVTLRLADADHNEVSAAVSTPPFTIERPSWPDVVIDRPANGAELLLPIQVGYRLDYADVATGPQDFELKLNDNEAVPLENNSSWLFDDLPPGEHTIEIRYKESSEADAVVTFTVRTNEEPNEANEKPPAKDGTESTGGGGSLSWLTVIFLAGLVSISGLRNWRQPSPSFNYIKLDLTP